MIRAVFGVIMLAGVLAGAAQAQTITRAELAEPTGRYGHHPMGPQVADHGALRLRMSDGSQRLIRLPQSRVFEDNAARLADIDGDGAPEVIVVEADARQGARLVVYGPQGVVAASPFIGRRNRWMAVSAVADLDGDGSVEIAVVDRPHLRKTLVIWRQVGAQLVPVAELAGVTNHRFGDPQILGGLRECGAGPELVLARADWSGLVAVRFSQGSLTAADLGMTATASQFQSAMSCAD